VVFALDSTLINFQFVRDFAESISIALKVGSPNSSVGVILFDTAAHIQFDLKEHTSLETLLPAIDGLPRGRLSGHSLYSPRADRALNLLRSGAQNDALGLRADTTNIAVVLIASRSGIAVATDMAANALHATNTYDVYAVGISSASIFELRTIASDPRFAYHQSSIKSVQQFVINQLCTSKCYLVYYCMNYDYYLS